MSAVDLLSILRSHNIRLWAENDQLRYSAPKGGMTDDLLAEIRKNKSELLNLLKNTEGFSEAVPLSPVERTDTLQPSFAQQRLWFLDQLEPDSPLYNIPRALRIAGSLNIDALQSSLDTIVVRHEALRTNFALAHGSPVPVFAEHRSVELPVIDLGELSAADRRAEVERLCAEEARRPFDLSSDLMMRARLYRLDEQEHVLLLVIHHIAADGWSMAVLFRELSVLYEAFEAGKSCPLSELSIQYADYAVWQRQWLQGEVLEKQLGYWKQQLDNAPPVLELPTDHPRPLTQTYRGARKYFSLGSSLVKGLKALSQKEGATLFMTLLAVFKILLHRYTAQDDIIIGSPIANRNRREIEGLIGFFVNTLVMRTDLSGNVSFRELLARVCKVAIEAYAHQDIPFEKLVAELQHERDFSHSPLFQILFVLQNAPEYAMHFSGLTLSPMDVEIGISKFDLTVSLEETAEGINGLIEFNSDLFDSDRIARMAGHFQTLLEGVVENPEQRVSDIQMLSGTEQKQILFDWNDSSSRYPRNVCVNQLFEQQVEQTPDAVAVVHGDEQLTYRELNARANQLAHYLKSLGVGPEVPVGVCLERSLEMIVALMGTLKAGGAYVPLDPCYPKERLNFILNDAQAKVLLTEKRLSEDVLESSAHTVCLDAERGSIAKESKANPAGTAVAENLAYVIYTSGSTGRPKGVCIAHCNTVALLYWAKDVFHSEDLAGVLASTSICFDLSVFELFLPLSRGGKVILAENALQLVNLPSANDATLINTVPSAITELLRIDGVPDSVRTICLAGEPLKNSTVTQIYQASKVSRVFDLYGPSEDTTYSTFALRDGDHSATIGKPIANSQIYLLDAHMQPVPVGVSGEICIGGDGLARGYLNRPELTAEKFVPNPFSKDPAARLYKTGDLARYFPDGNIEFLGRIDHQVKIRGFRIELGEIESGLGRHPALEEAVVIAREDVPDDKRLVAYVVAGHEPAPTFGELRSFLKRSLPDYMIPSALVYLDSLPLTPNGKVDRLALPAPDAERPDIEESFVAPRNAVEEALAQIWGEIMRIEKVGIHDNFFELGGHSLMATQIISRVSDTFQVEVPLLQLFLYPTIAELAIHIAEKQEKTEQDTVQQLLEDFEDLSDEEAERLLAQELNQNEREGRQE